MRATGIQWTFAPCVAVARDERWGRTYEGFGEEPALVAELGAAAVRGLQGPDLDGPAARAGLRQALRRRRRHGLGHRRRTDDAPGGASRSTRATRGSTRPSCGGSTCRATSTAIAAGVGSIMPSYNSWNGEKASGSKRLLTDILKGELGFEGFLISDYNAIDAAARRLPQPTSSSRSTPAWTW